MKVELISKSIGVGEYSELNHSQIIAAVARHGTIKEDGGRLVRYLMDNNHLSPLQHVYFGFKITTSRAISAQIFRHSSLDFQERSQRYDKIVSVEPIEIRREHPTNRQSSTEPFNPIIEDYDLYSAQDLISETLNQIQYAYSKLLEAGVAKECARMILPMASSTDIHVSGNLRSFLSFLNVRCDSHAQKEIREIAYLIGEELEKQLPDVFAQINWRDGMFL